MAPVKKICDECGNKCREIHLDGNEALCGKCYKNSKNIIHFTPNKESNIDEVF